MRSILFNSLLIAVSIVLIAVGTSLLVTHQLKEQCPAPDTVRLPDMRDPNTVQRPLFVLQPSRSPQRATGHYYLQPTGDLPDTHNPQETINNKRLQGGI